MVFYGSAMGSSQHGDINRTHDILQDDSKCEMIVVIENFMTSSAMYADIGNLIGLFEEEAVGILLASTTGHRCRHYPPPPREIE